MSKIKLTINVFALLIFSMAFTARAEALPLRTFISSSGLNTNPCSLAQPCRTFAGALNKTEPGGEITALDSGEYGVVTINRGITLQAAPGVYAVLTPAADKDAVVVKAVEGDVVLRGLTLAGGKQARYGVSVKSVNSLHVESCLIHGFNGGGIALNPDGTANGIFVKDTIVRGNGGASVLLQPASGKPLVSIDNCRLEDSGVGLLAVGGGSLIAVRDSTIAGNRTAGVSIEGDVEINFGNCMVSNNGTLGISARRGAIARVSSSTVTNNAVAGLSNTIFDPGVIETIGNNLIRGNQKNFEGSITTISGQ